MVIHCPVGPTIDGAIVATSHASHFDVGMALLKEGIHRRKMAEAIEKEEEGTSKVGKKRRKMLQASGGADENGAPQSQIARPHKILHRALHILMEKPMTTNVEEARKLWEMSAKRYPEGECDLEHYQLFCTYSRDNENFEFASHFVTEFLSLQGHSSSTTPRATDPKQKSHNKL